MAIIDVGDNGTWLGQIKPRGETTCEEGVNIRELFASPWVMKM